MSGIIETLSSHDVAARDALAQIRAIVQAVPGYGFAGTMHRQRISFLSAVPDRFFYAVAVALDALPIVAAAAGVTGAQLRDAVAYSNAYRPFANELALMANGVVQGVIATRAEKASLGLKAYRLSKGYNSAADRELLVPHIANMREALGRGRPKSKSSTEPEIDPETGTPADGGGNA
jgi:hypothetical protein